MEETKSTLLQPSELANLGFSGATNAQGRELDLGKTVYWTDEVKIRIQGVSHINECSK